MYLAWLGWGGVNVKFSILDATVRIFETVLKICPPYEIGTSLHGFRLRRDRVQDN